MNTNARVLALGALVSFLAISPPALAEPKAPEDVKSVLARSQGSRVSLRLSAGEELSGKVAAVGDRTVHLTELAGREFFEAVVALDDVVAVIFRSPGK